MTDTVAKLRERVENFRKKCIFMSGVSPDFPYNCGGALSHIRDDNTSRLMHAKLAPEAIDIIDDLPALLASVERLQSLEQMLREPGEDVKND